MKKVSIYLITILLTLGCSVDSGQEELLVKTGSLSISISDTDNRTIEPDFDMNIASYDLTGTHNVTSETFTVSDITDIVVTQSDLSIGSWSLYLTAKNASGVVIGTGSAVCEIEEDVTTSVTITLEENDGVGDFTLLVRWPVDRITTPVMTGTLTSYDGTPITLSPLYVNNQVESSLNDVDSGYYILHVILNDDTNTMYRIIESVRIIKDQTTNYTIELDLDDLNLEELPITGNLSLSIDNSNISPIVINNTGYLETLILGNGMTITVTPSITPETYTWYLDGEVIADETTNTITLGSTMGLGNYRLDCIVQKGEQIASESFPFAVNETYVVGGRGEAHGWVFYDKGEYTDGWRYLEAATKDIEGTFKFGITAQLDSSHTSYGIGDGKTNTDNIYANYADIDGALDATNSFSDGINGVYRYDYFLPSRQELQEMYTVLHLNGKGNFKDDVYWSNSFSGITIDYVYTVNFGDGTSPNQYKLYENLIRPIRAF